jgi:diketogulonate reductase-like aldo/keto reductase
MQSPTDTYALPGNVGIPCIGYGTWQLADGDRAVAAVRSALDCGYRHIDTAAAYGNEESVGRAVRQSGLTRSEVFITSKLANNRHGYANTRQAFDQTLHNLQTDYLDLYLIHWPNPISSRSNWQEANSGSWLAFEEFYRTGRIRAIGVSNFRPHHFAALMQTATIPPMVNQIRHCPGDTQDDVVAYCRAHSILIEAYSPFGVGRIFDVPEMQALARKYGKSVAQIAIRWSLQRGALPLPKSETPARIQENIKVFDFSLSAEDVQAIADLKGCCGTAADPDTITW